MLRSARLTPPGPTLSPIGWTTPYRSGISRSWRMLSKPPTENADTTKSASASALRRSGSARTVIAMFAAPRDLGAELGHRRGPLVIEVVEDELGPVQRVGVREVGQQARATSGSSRHPR